MGISSENFYSIFFTYSVKLNVSFLSSFIDYIDVYTADEQGNQISWQLLKLHHKCTEL